MLYSIATKYLHIFKDKKKPIYLGCGTLTTKQSSIAECMHTTIAESIHTT